MENKINLTVDENGQNTRLDKYLAIILQEHSLSREKIKKAILDSRVTINNKVIVTPNYLLKAGQDIELEIASQKPTHLNPTEIDLNIIYEDDDLLVINKQAGLTVHPGSGNQNHTLVNALLARKDITLSNIGEDDRPGIVHRLDKNTTGLMVVAKTDAAHLSLSNQLQQKSLTRKYYALVWGLIKPDQGTINLNIARSSRNRKLMDIVVLGGKEARTHYQTKEIFLNGKLSLVECQLETGRTHQIRVHMSHIGNSVFGDPEYGHHQRKLKKFINESEQEFYEFNRQALHSYYIKFMHPSSGEEKEFFCDLPKDMKKLIRVLQRV